MEASPVNRRTSPRVPVALELHLARRTGRGLVAHTSDLGVGGARIVSSRPLRIDEELGCDFGLPDGDRLHATARVLRQDRHDVYALRFEQLSAASSARLGAFVASAA